MKKEKSCGCIVFDSDNNVLLVQMKHGHWSFPKGHVETNETEEQTALRETLEETNIECEIMPGFREVTTYSPSHNAIKDVIYFIAKPINHNTIRQETEISVVNFYSVEEALKLITYPNDLEILKKAVLFLKQGTIV